MKVTRLSSAPSSPRREAALLEKFQPFPIRHILVPIDFSEAGRSAVRYAKELAEWTGAEVYLVHVLQKVYSAPEFDYIQLDSGRMCDLLRRKLEVIQRTQFPRITTECIIRTGFPFEEIVEAARKTMSDLIVMAPHGHSTMQHFFLGSTTERVIRRAACPVLVVRSGASPNRAKPRKTPIN